MTTPATPPTPPGSAEAATGAAPSAAMPTGAFVAALSPRRRVLAYVSILMSLLTGTIDASIVNIALPRMSLALHAAPSDTVWVATAFLLAVACTVPATAALGDQLGRRRMYLIGVPVFTLASLGCALSPTLGWLIAFRAIQGVGSATIFAVAIPLYRRLFPPEQLGQIFGFNGMTVALGTSIGPTVGGLILQVANWPWLFLINLPIGAAAFVLAVIYLPRGTSERGDYDGQGAVLAALAVASFLIGLRQLVELGTLWLGAVLLVGSAAFLTLFIRRERRATRPLIPLGLFTGMFSLSVATAAASFLGQGVASVALSFLFQSAYHATPLQAALLYTPWPVAIMLVAPLAGRLADRLPSVYLVVSGLSIMAVGLIVLALLGEHPPIWIVMTATALVGLGFGAFQSPNNRDMMAAAPLRYAAAATAVLNSNRTVAQSTGSALVSMALVLAGASVGPASVAHQAAAAEGVLWVAVAAAVAAAVLSLVKMRSLTAAGVPLRPGARA